MTSHILFVYPGNTAKPGESGGQKRAYHLINELSKRNEVSVLETEDGGTGSHPIRDVSRYTITHPFPSYLIDLYPPLVYRIKQLINKLDIDLVHVAFPYGVPTSILASRLTERSPPVVFDAQSVAGSFLSEITTNADVPLYKKLGGRAYIPLIERLAARFADQINVVSEKDRKLFRDTYGLHHNRFVVIPSGVPDTEIDVPRKQIREKYDIPETERTIVFHGQFNYPPNRTAIEILKSEIAPALEKQVDDFSIVIAGNGVPEDSDMPIRSVGYVENLYSFLNAMDIAAVPLRAGGGIKMKTLDYMSVALPIVSTPMGVEGLDVVDGEHLLVADSIEEEFNNHLIRLILQPAERERLSNNIKSIVRKKYSWAQVGSTINNSYDKILE